MIRALLYADARSIVNQLHEIRRHPGRALLWGLWILMLGGFIALRLIAPHRHGAPASPGALAQTDLIVSAAVGYLGIMLFSGKTMTGLFAHIAEARFIIGAPVSPVIATLYIQFREILRRGSRVVLTSAYLILVYLPRTVPAPAIARDLLYVIGGFIALAAVPLPRRLLHGAAATIAAGFGVLCILLAIAPLARDAAVLFPLPHGVMSVLLRLPDWHPGSMLTEPFDAHSALVFAIFVAVTAVAFLVLARTAGDAYPELYAFSLERFSRVERMRNRRLGGALAMRKTPGIAANIGTVTTENTKNVPPGAAVFIWRAWTHYRRSNSPRSTGIETAAILIAGFLIGRFAGDRIGALASISFAVANITIIFAIGAATRIGAELKKPLFWLSGATLFERLAALAVGDSWRVIAWCALLGIGLIAGGAQFGVDITAVVLAPCVILLATAVGYALYALLPNDIDQRGPLAIVRVILIYVLAAPAAGVGIACGILLSSAILGLIVAAAAAFVEAAVLIGFASWRLDRAAALPHPRG